MMVSYLHVLRRSLKAVPQAITMQSSLSLDFAFKTVITASYCFPTYRTRLLERINLFIPYHFHLDPSLMDVIEFKANPNSVCKKYEELIPTPDEIESASISDGTSLTIVGESSDNSKQRSRLSR